MQITSNGPVNGFNFPYCVLLQIAVKLHRCCADSVCSAICRSVDPNYAQSISLFGHSEGSRYITELQRERATSKMQRLKMPISPAHLILFISMVL